jgi:enoyl-CoA hydratase/carnithine racemase
MSEAFNKAYGHTLPTSLNVEVRDRVAIIRISRPEKRNAINDETLFALERLFANMPPEIGCAIIHGEGGNFSAGLDLSEVPELDMMAAMDKSHSWHRALKSIEFGKVPLIAVLHGVTIGGGLELACSAHVRIAEQSAFYALPEGQRGIFVGGGGSVRIPRLIGTSRMMEMMLTGRTYGAEEGKAIGLTHYVVEDGGGLDLAIDLAHKIVGNEPFTNFAVMNILPRIAEAEPVTGYLLEAAISAAASTNDAAKARMRAFLAKQHAKVEHHE